MKKFIRSLSGKSSGGEKESQDYYNHLATDVLARTLWGEARGDGTQGMEAVANVILNRVRAAQARGGYWWGNDLISVCQKPYQFSCWNRSDPNFQKLQAVEDSDVYFATALRIARRAVAGVLPDITNGATHYHTKDILPDWARAKAPSATIGHHLFYQLLS